jgi:putative transposase
VLAVGLWASRRLVHRSTAPEQRYQAGIRPLDKHESVRGSQYAAGTYRELLARHGLIGSMGRRGNPYDNA